MEFETEAESRDKCQPFEIKTENISKHPQDDRIRPYLCPVCDKRFTHRGTMKRHILTHSEEKTFVCTFCDKRYKSKVGLNYHKRRIHTLDNNTVEKVYSCSECEKSFSLEKSLRWHKNIHTEAYKCTVCGLSLIHI